MFLSSLLLGEKLKVILHGLPLSLLAFDRHKKSVVSLSVLHFIYAKEALSPALEGCVGWLRVNKLLHSHLLSFTAGLWSLILAEPPMFFQTHPRCVDLAVAYISHQFSVNHLCFHPS